MMVVYVLVSALALVVSSLAGGAATAGRAAGQNEDSCERPTASVSYSEATMRALRARRDVWGEKLLHSSGGPTYDGARRFLAPLLLAQGKGRPLTASGFHYAALSIPSSVDGARTVALHVADGSQVVADHVYGPTLTVFAGAERFGSCFSRLTPGSLAAGWLPILQTRYVDAVGNRYAQESFVWHLPKREAEASFVRLTVDAREPVALRMAVAGGETRTLPASAGKRSTLSVAWQGGHVLSKVSSDAYDAARRATTAYWTRRLGEGAFVQVPERRVMNAWRSVLVQNLVLAWRYSIGNPYEEFSYPEALDVAQVAAEWGRGKLSRSIVEASLAQRPTRYPNWKKAERLLAAAVYYRLYRDRAELGRVTAALRAYVSDFDRQIASDPHGLLARERYSSDIPDSVYGLHSQAVAWQGMRAIAAAWADVGKPDLARSTFATANRLERGLRRAVEASETRLEDGSLFVQISLVDGERPYGSVTEARLGSYWNLVMPYALASGFFRAGGERAEGIFDYMRIHGARMLGLVRAGAYRLYGEGPFPRGGTDEVYGNSVARFLADNDKADQLVLALYGQLAVAMTPGTFVGGEAASVAPDHDEYLRTAYLPPNSASNATFLTKLRLMLVRETRGANGEPDGLQLGFATPRAWLEPGKRIVVRRMPTSAGPVSFEILAYASSLQATVRVPGRKTLAALALRLRLPDGRRIVAVRVNGRSSSRFDTRTSAIDLTGRGGTVEVAVRTAVP